MAKLKEIPQIIINFSLDLLRGNIKECSIKLKNSSSYLLDKILSPNSFIRYEIWKYNKAQLKYIKNESNFNFALIYFWQDKLDQKILKKLEKSLNNQLYKNFELIQADQIKNNDLSKFSHICFIEQKDIISAHSLNSLSNVIQNNPEMALIYSDEDIINRFGIRVNPYFKTCYAPLILLSHNYMSAFLCLKNNKNLISELKNNRINQKFLYQITLKLTDLGIYIYRIPDVLYHRSWKNTEKIAKTSTKDIIKDKVTDLNSKIVNYNIKGINILKFYPINNPKISIIIPFKDKVDYLKQCIESIETRSTYKNYEILLVNNRSNENETFDYLNTVPFKIIDADIDFNYSKLNNIGAQEAQGDYLLLLNNDTKIITSDWLESSLGILQLPKTGAVGLRVLFPNNRIQETGSLATNANANCLIKRNNPGYKNFIHIIREYAWFAGACLFVSKEKYFEVGGLNEDLANECNDSDFCFKLLKAGYYNVYNPHAEIYHYESVTRKKIRKMNGNAYVYMGNNWGYLISDDPFHNPNFSNHKTGFCINIR